MIRRVSEHEQIDGDLGVALFQLDYGPEETVFPQADENGAVFWGYFVNGFTFPQDETGPVLAEFTVSEERGAYLLNGASTNNFLPRLAIVLAVKLNGRWFICDQVYVP